MRAMELSNVEQSLLDIQEKMGSWNTLIRDVEVPTDLALALMTGRSELVCAAKVKTLSPNEVTRVYVLIGCLLETNQALQRSSALVAELAKNMLGNAKGLMSSVNKLEDFANFRNPMEEDPNEF